MTLLEFQQDVERFDSQLDEIRTRNADDMAEWPAGQVLKFDEITTARSKAQDKVDVVLERQDRLAKVRAAYDEGGSNLEASFSAPANGYAARRKDPYADLGPNLSRSDSIDGLKSRALDAIEQTSERVPDAGRELLAKLLDRSGDTSAAEYVLATAQPAYRSAFEKILANPIHGHLMWDQDEVRAYQRTDSVRTALSLTSANGGYMVPLTLDPSIILTNSGALNPWRDLATIKTTTTNTWQGVTSAGVTAEWTTEGTEAADASPTVGTLSINAEKADAYVFGSYEVLGDTDFAEQLPTLLADAKNRLEEAAFATGAGHAGTPPTPMGVITAVAAASGFTTGSTTNVLSSADVFSLLQSVPDRWRQRASIVMNDSVGMTLRQLGTSLGAQFWANMGEAQPEVLVGKPYRESTTMTSAIATGGYIAVAGDFSQYYIVDRLGMQMVYVPAVIGTNRRPTGQAGWYAYWRVGGNCATTNAFKILKVK